MLCYFTILLLLRCSATLSTAEEDEQNVYIVYMGGRGGREPLSLASSHHATLKDVLGSEQKARDSIRHSYTHGFSAFSAKLSKSQAETISRMPNVVSVYRSRQLQLHTTRSWDFLGFVDQTKKQLQASFKTRGTYDVVIGVVDTGLWPEAESFDDTGFGPPPARWKGLCNNTGITNTSEIFKCNNKVIGGRGYAALATNPQASDIPFGNGLLGVSTEATKTLDFQNARDSLGHGTHTSSTAAGALAVNASFFGLAEGNARGYQPARVAMYKVCFDFCSDEAILAAFDDAIHDGVDVLSLSLGASPTSYDLDSMAIGSFHAVENGITVSCSAGNGGPDPASVTNGAPWILTVGASTIDRRISASIRLGNNITLSGSGLNFADSSDTLVFAGDIPAKGETKSAASRCLSGAIDVSKLKGKIVFCIFDPDVGINVRDLDGASGVIISGDVLADLVFHLNLSNIFVRDNVGEKILAYIHSTENPTGTIFKSVTVSKVSPAPVVAGFSSRGPNTISPDILKPDVTAPGVNILAAWPEVSLVPINGERVVTKYNILSGTSMSCPHVAGAAAFLKSVHPDWSPAAIRSALMTTASVLDNTNAPITDFNGSLATPFDIGSGEINPEKAADPGLVYDTTPEDYVAYLCQTGYNITQVRLITGSDKTTCPSGRNSTDAGPPSLNYPSMAFVGLKTAQKTQRTVTNVGPPTSVYALTVLGPPNISIVVSPSTLSFTSTGQKLSFTVTITPQESVPRLSSSTWVFAFITWSDGSHTVRSPMAVTSASASEISS